MASYNALDSPDSYAIAWIAALPIERAAVKAMLDEEHAAPTGFTRHQTDHNIYTWGRVGEHNIVITSLAAGDYGPTSAATTASGLLASLPSIRLGLLVGIGGGIARPEEGRDIRLGDIVVSQPHGTTGGQYDLIKANSGDKREHRGFLGQPPTVLLNALTSIQAHHERKDSKVPSFLQEMLEKYPKMGKKSMENPGYAHPGLANDRLFRASCDHVAGPDCQQCDTADEVQRDPRDTTDPEIHYGTIASGNTVVRDAAVRDRIVADVGKDCICFEMEAAGLMNHFPCLVIRGISDYADSHKNDRWQRYASATAAAYAKELLAYVPAAEVQNTKRALEMPQSVQRRIDGMQQTTVATNAAIDPVTLLSSTDGQTWTKSANESTALTSIDPHPPKPEEKSEQPGEDAESVYTSATNTDAMAYIDRLAEDLFCSTFSKGLPDSETLQRVCEALPSLLRGFAFRLGGESQVGINSEIMTFVDRKRKIISKSFQALYSQEKEDAENSRKRTHDRMSTQKVFDMWRATTDGFDLTLPPFHEESEAEHEESNRGSDNSTGEDDAESDNMPSYTGVVAASSAYKWLLGRLDQEILLCSPQNDGKHKISEAVRGRLYSSLGDRLVISKAGPPVCKMVFRSDWSPMAFVREQEYMEEPGEALESAITITEGVDGVAEAMPCSQYLVRTWQYLGEAFIGLVKGAVRAKPSSRCSVMLFDGSKLVAWIDPTGCFALEAVGVPETLVEVGEMFAWTAAALRSAPGDEVTIVIPCLDADAQLNEMTCRVQSYQPALRPPSGRPNGQCWKDLFRNPVVVQGFPVRRRRGEEQGLEIDLGTLAKLLQTRRVAIFGDRVLLKGFCTMLIPTQYAQGTVFWHVIFNEDGSRISYADDRVSNVAGDFDLRKFLNIRNIETTRHIIGWCARVKSNAGSKEAAYGIEDTSLPLPRPEIGIDRFAVSIGKLISFGFSGVLGRKDKPLRNGSAPDFFRRLQSMDDRYVVLYDVQERRAWLVHALSALLHLVRASLKLDEILGYPVLLNEDDIREAEPTLKGVAAARAVLVNPDNLKLKIFKNPDKEVVEITVEEELEDDQEVGSSQKQLKVKKKRVSRIQETWVHFHDRVDDMCHLLESVFDHQQDDGEKDGVSVRIRTSPRRLLEGFQFKDLASAMQRSSPRVATLGSPGAGWVDFIRAIGGVTLFGDGFGELLEPVGPVESSETAGAVKLCDRWVALPKGEDLLAVSNLVIQDIMKRRIRDGILWELVDNIYWHKPDKAFEACHCTEGTGRHCDRVQVLLPTKFPKIRTRKLRSPSSLPEDGAVVFGHSVTFPLLWGDDPQSVPMEGIPTESTPSEASVEPSAPRVRLEVSSTAPSTVSSTRRQDNESLDSTAPPHHSLRKRFKELWNIGSSKQSLSLGEDSEGG